MPLNNPIQLQDGAILLRPICIDDKAPLTALAFDKKIWAGRGIDLHLPNTFQAQWFDKAINSQTRLVFTILDNDRIIGSSSFYEIDEQNKRLTIGYTWFAPNIWGSAINAIVKRLMLDYVFNECQFHRASFCVDNINHRSKQALLNLGATKEGVLRNHIIRADGSLRDSVIFSFIDNEWQKKRDHITETINKKLNTF